MRLNVELKARCGDLDRVRRACLERGGRVLLGQRETDTYFKVGTGRLKLRTGSASEPELIHYDRLDSPTARASRFAVVPVGRLADHLLELLTGALGVRCTVTKFREKLVLGPALLNLDSVEGLGSFVEIEVDAAKAGGEVEAHRFADELKAHLGIEDSELVPWSYSDLTIMTSVAAIWRARLAESPNAGTLLLVDGPSGSGKTTLVHRVLEDASLDLAFVRRYSTREPRASAATESEYRFVTPGEFRRIANEGGFVESRDFLFGMSYGLTWVDALTPILEGHNALGIMNLGNVGHVRRILPEAITVLIAASPATLERRLVARGYNDASQIRERLENARRVVSLQAAYHHVIENEDGGLDRAKEALRAVVLSYRRGESRLAPQRREE